MRLSLLAAIWAGFTSAAVSADRWQVTANVDIFQVPEKEALALIPRLSGTSANAVLKQLSETATGTDGGTRRLAALTARFIEGHPAVNRSGEERNYPIEYEQENPRIGVPMDAPLNLPDATGYPTTTFETRECGAKMELSAKVHPSGESMQLDCVVQHTHFDRWTRYETATRADGMKLYVEQPEFVQRKSSTSVLLSPGKPILLGSYRMPEKDGMFELHVLSARTRRIDDVNASAPEPLTDEMEALLPALFPKRDMRVEILSFSVAAREAIALRGQLLSEREAGQALATLIALAGSDSARLIDWQTIPSVTSGRAIADNFREIRYGIEHDSPSNIPGSFSDQIFYSGPAWQGEPCLVPTTFETRNLGTRFEVECEQYGEMHLNLSNVALSHFLRWGAGPDRDGKASHTYEPQFTNRIFRGAIAVADGKPLLIRFAKEQGASDRYEIAVLRAYDRQP